MSVQAELFRLSRSTQGLVFSRLRNRFFRRIALSALTIITEERPAFGLSGPCRFD
jgi:hypothetical protein